MATHASTLLLLAIVVGLASFASAQLSQRRARHGHDTLALAGVGIGTALLLTAVFLIVFGMVLFVYQWLARWDRSVSMNETSIGEVIARPNPFGDAAIGSSGRLDAQMNRERAPRRREASAPRESHRQSVDASVSAASIPSLPPFVQPAQNAADRGILSANDPWAATRCVVPIKREWTDGTRWTVVNDCGVAVAIAIALCERPASACSNDAWRYPTEGLHLPAKAHRPTTEAEETQFAIELRHAACVVTDPAASDLIGIELAARTEQWRHDFEEARARDTCLNEVRRLAALGARSGVPLDALLGGTLFSRAGQ